MITSIDQELCNSCGVCGDICPRHIPETVKAGDKKTTSLVSERINLCLSCGHCAAVCTRNAVRILEIPSEALDPVIELEMTPDQLLTLLRQRRSIRRYRDRPVPRPTIDRIIGAAQTAPTGTARDTTGVIVIDDPELLAEFGELVFKLYESLDRYIDHPIARRVIKRRAGEKNFRTLTDFLMAGMAWYIRWYREGKSDEILRGCRAVMLFHAPIFEPVSEANCLLAAYHAVLMAHVMGLGTCFSDTISQACNQEAKIRKFLELTDDREVYAALTLGYPKYVFRRVPVRKLAEIRYLA